MTSNKFTKPIISLLFLISCLGASLSVLADDLEDEVKIQLATIAKGPSSVGRASWNQEMLRVPSQLSRDITRSPLHIGSKDSEVIISGAMLKGMTPIDAYKMVAKKLVDYIKSMNKAFNNDDNPTKIGKFWISEILYATAQTIPILISMKGQTDNMALLLRWGGSAADDKSNINISYSLADDNVTVAHTLTRKLKDRNNKLNPFSKTYILNAATHFDIGTGKVWWTLGYSLDGKKVEWTSQTLPKY